MKIRISLITISLFLSACGGQQADIHSMARETKDYESALIENMDQAELMQHLNLLASEMNLATKNGLYVEMHHIEIALTKAFNALEAIAPATAKSNLDTLKVVAVKIHGVGHDQNKSMAGTLNKTLQDQLERLQKNLNAN